MSANASSRMWNRQFWNAFGLRLLAVSLLSALSSGTLRSQSMAVIAPTDAQSAELNTASTVSPLDHSVLTPVASALLGQTDATALTELKASGAAMIGAAAWAGLQATGTLTYAGDSNQYGVTLTNLGSNHYRLDTQMPTGVESVRISGRAGRIQSKTGQVIPIDPDTAIMGIFPFEIIARASSPAKNITLVDRGEVSTNGHPLHRVTLELSSILRDPATKSQKALPMDLYFDPSTHLLVKTVNSILIPGARLVPFLSVVAYSDYRTVGTSLIPFHYVETINGQPFRTLQLTSAHTNPTLPQDYFQFERSNQ